MAINTTPVVSGELIESSWGNAVHSDLNTLDTTKLSKAGGVMTGQLGLPGATGAASTDAARRDWVTANFFDVAGDTVDGGIYIFGTDPNSGRGVKIVCNTTAEDLRGRVVIAAGPAAAGTASLVVCRTNGVAGMHLEQFYTGILATLIGSISVASASSVAYNTTSDQRLKERTGDAADAADIIATLGRLAYRGRWIADEGAGEEWVFLNSQDVEPIVPYAVSGAADGVVGADDPDGRAAGTIIPQQLDHSALVPLLCAALSQALDRITALEAAA